MLNDTEITFCDEITEDFPAFCTAFIARAAKDIKGMPLFVDYRKGLYSATSIVRRLSSAISGLSWILSNDDTHPFTFERMCHELDADPNIIRNKIISMSFQRIKEQNERSQNARRKTKKVKQESK